MTEQKITLREITKETELEICRLEVAENQKQFVASNVNSIAEAKLNPDCAWFRGIYTGEVPVGFVMVRIDPLEDYFFLWRFMIDKKYQKRGFGQQGLECTLDYLKSKGKVRRIITSYHQSSGDPSGFYKKFGFKEVSNTLDWGELGQEMIRLGETRMELEF
jgi:diamine N-acetyltransferase